MNNLLDFLIEVLCQQGTTSKCYEFVQSYPDPVHQMIFFVFFPMIFLIIFISLLTEKVTKKEGLKLLVSIAILILIIIEGWYHIVLVVSKFWIFAIVILGGIYVVFHMGPFGGGGKDEGRGEAKAAGNWVKEALFGGQILDPKERARNAKLCSDALRNLNRQRGTLEARMSRVGSPDERKELMALIGRLDEAIVDVEEKKRLGQPPTREEMKGK